MSASVEQQVRGVFAKADKPDLDEDILTYVIACLEDESFEFGNGGEEIYDTVGPMLVCAHIVPVQSMAPPLVVHPHANQPPNRDERNISVRLAMCLAV